MNAIRIVPSGRPCAPHRRLILDPSIVPTVRLTLRIGSEISTGRPVLDGLGAALDERVVQSAVEAMVLRLHAAAADRVRDFGLVQNRRQVDAARLPVVHRPANVQAVGPADHLVHGAEAELRHQLPDLSATNRK